MKKIFFCVTVALVSSLSAGRASAQATRRVTAENYNDYGLVYSLPTTALSITLKAEHIVGTAGPYAQYSKKYLGTTSSIKEDYQEWNITGAEASTYGVTSPDAESYRIQLKSSNPAYICTTPDGMLLTLNCEAPQSAVPEAPKREIATSGLPHLTGEEYLSFVSEDFLSATSSAKKAQYLSESLVEVKDSKLSLTRGTSDMTPTDGRQLELMLSSLSDQEKALTAAFTGSERKETGTMTLSFVPAEEGRFVIARLSDYGGFTDPDDLSGEPVYLTVNVTRRGEIPVDEKGNTRELPKDAVVYRIPGTARITIGTQTSTLLEFETEFAQYGENFGLAPNIFTDKKDPKYAIFSPVTGNVVEIGPVNSIRQ